ncbi:hypothetical protein ASC95_18235 [Pelomonas sp. Root1217]|uniref:hypothetical protein n=1 Tax=Pelomonas sp. Root1217 TaxID=1736430 RepID=UPI00070C8FB7|nr:hypothetical protein [Pelomonas sp. Root1217]KQV49528.1 hypothetical protein ASC95_18235 [Pelomonas sp. Root1217]
MNPGEPNPNQTSRERVQDVIDGRAEEASSPARLQPKQPPGQRSRKARRFADEIQRLHAEGYSLDSIRESLADAGIVVSWSTVQREAARHAHGLPPRDVAKPQPDLPASAVRRPVDASAQAVAPSAAALRQSGKEVAQAFFEAHNSNPLLRKDKR